MELYGTKKLTHSESQAMKIVCRKKSRYIDDFLTKIFILRSLVFTNWQSRNKTSYVSGRKRSSFSCLCLIKKDPKNQIGRLNKLVFATYS